MTAPLATLPMYEWPAMSGSTDRLWSAIRANLTDAGIPAPERLSRDIDLWEAWQSPGLVLAQTCGMPYRTRLHGRVGLVGTPDFGLPDAPAGYYYSVFVARPGDASDPSAYADRTLAYNSPDSQSGWAAPQNHMATRGHGPFRKTHRTGAHRLSAEAVASGAADIAAIDGVTWRLLSRWEPGLAGALKVIGRTDPTPGLPYITALGNDAGAVAAAVRAAIAGLGHEDRDTLGLRGLVAIPAARYLAVPNPAPPAR